MEIKIVWVLYINYRWNRETKKLVLVLTLIFLLVSCKKDSPKRVQDKLTGNWLGTYSTVSDVGMVEFNFENDGHFSASMISGPYSSVFPNSADNIDHEKKRFVIFYLDGFGNAHGEATYVAASDSLLISSPFNDLRFTEQYGTEVLTFNIGGATVELSRK